MTVSGEVFALFRDATVRQRLALAALLGSFLGTGAWGCSYVGTVMGNMVPVSRTVTVHRIVKRAYPPLKDPHQACSGAPVIIENISIAGSQGDKSGKVYTYVSVRPAGDDYNVICDVGGDYSSNMRVGDLVRLFSGEVSA